MDSDETVLSMNSSDSKCAELRSNDRDSRLISEMHLMIV